MYVAQAGLELLILTASDSQVWDHRYVPPHLAHSNSFLEALIHLFILGYNECSGCKYILGQHNNSSTSGGDSSWLVWHFRDHKMLEMF
jgi:hypothetical protein